MKTASADMRVQAATAIVSVIALLVSIRSCRDTERATRIAERQSERETLAVWTWNILPGKSAARLKSMDPNMAIQRAAVWLPPGFYWQMSRPDFVVIPPDYEIPLDPPASQIRAFLTNRGFAIRRPDGGYSVTSGGEQALPVVIESTYVARGEVHSDRAVYFMHFKWTPPKRLGESPPFQFEGEPTVNFSDLQLEKRIDVDAKLEDVLDEAQRRTLLNEQQIDLYRDPYRRSWFKPRR